MELKGIYYYIKDNDILSLQKCDLFSDDEILSINASAQTMNRLFKNLERSVAAQNAYNEFVTVAQKVICDNPYVRIEIDRKFRGFILEWKLYIEHWRSYIRGLTDSFFSKEYIKAYNDLYYDLYAEAFRNEKYVTAHVVRNYVSHYGEAVTYYHLGNTNEFCIGRDRLLSFLDNSIQRAKKLRKEHLQAQKEVIEKLPKLIDLNDVAYDAMGVLRWFESNLMNYQIEPQTIQAAHILQDARDRIDESGIDAEIWEILSPDPLTMNDRELNQQRTLRSVKNDKPIEITTFFMRLEWENYQLVTDLIHTISQAL